MKTLITLAIILGMSCYSCTNVPPQVKNRQKGSIEMGVAQSNIPYEIVTIDGCEYIMLLGLHETPLTHKGNCKNPIHIYRNL